ncbi:MAG: 50S ribosomal protein L23 [Patescibacteria group bacterium]|jgi:large subunit ribosomal protein L23
MSEILIAPIITEKAVSKVDQGSYVFKVSRKANKIQIANAITDLYKVKVEKVNVINKKPESVFIKGKSGQKKAWKKAIITLKKGQKIAEFEQK